MMVTRQLAALGLFALVATSAGAQPAGAAPLPGSPASNAEAAQRAQKESERTLYWIRVLADKPAAKAAPNASSTTTAATPAKPSPRARPVETARNSGVPTSPAASGGASSPNVSEALNGSGPIDLPPTAAGPSSSAKGAAATLSAGADPTQASPPIGMAALAAPTVAAPALDLPGGTGPGFVLPAASTKEAADAGLVLAEAVDPRFPPSLMSRLRKGHVEVRFDVAADGHVEAVSVEQTSHHGLEPAALDAVRQWRFQPGARGHTAIVDLAFDMDS